MKQYCYYCDEDMTYTLKEKEMLLTVKEKTILCKQTLVYCDSCNEEIYIPKIDDLNIAIAHKEYEKELMKKC